MSGSETGGGVAEAEAENPRAAGQGEEGTRPLTEGVRGGEGREQGLEKLLEEASRATVDSETQAIEQTRSRRRRTTLKVRARMLKGIDFYIQ